MGELSMVRMGGGPKIAAGSATLPNGTYTATVNISAYGFKQIDSVVCSPDSGDNVANASVSSVNQITISCGRSAETKIYWIVVGK